MPQMIPAIAAAVTWVGGAAAAVTGVLAAPLVGLLGEGAAIAVAGGALKIAAFTALSAGMNAVLAPKVGAGGSPTAFKADPAAPIRGVMGRFGTGGTQMHMRSWGGENVFLSYMTALSLGPIAAIAGFTANGTAVTFPGAQGAAALVEPYRDKMWQTSKLGLPTDGALGPPTGQAQGSPSMTEWTSAHKSSGHAAVFWTMRNNSKRAGYEGGVPQPLWTVNGMLVWDPRLDSTYPGGSGAQRRDNWTTWTYSENPYLHALAFTRGHFKNLTGGTIDRTKRLAGIGAPDRGIDIASFVEGANVADANGWVISGEWTTADDKWSTLAAMLQAGGGVPLNRGAQIGVMVNTPRASLLTYTGADLVGPVNLKVMASRRDRFNTIIPRYRGEDQKWEVVAAGAVTSSVYLAEDRGEPRSREIEYSYVRLPKQAAELAAYDLANSREGLNTSLPSKPYLLGLDAGDAFTVSEPELGLNGQKVIVLRRSFKPEDCVVTLEVRSETDAKHDWALGRTADPPPTPGLTVVTGSEITTPSVGAWSAAAEQLVSSSGEVPIIRITGAVDPAAISLIIVEFRAVGESAWSSRSFLASATNLVITGVSGFTTYDLRIRYANALGIEDAAVYLSLGQVTTGAWIASDTLNVNGEPAADIVARLASAEGLVASTAAAVDDLEDIYGDTASAAASAASAAADAAAAILAKSDAIAAKTDAVAAAGASATSASQAGGFKTAAETASAASIAAKVAAESARDAASGSATAAAGSASSASTSATAAGTSASAANTSATNAATQAGSAATSATAASTSATNALGSANAASTSATAAAGSATAAGGSATAAAGSASTASTHATNAGNSAAAAAASSVAASSVYGLTREAASKLFPPLLDATASMFTEATSGDPATVAAVTPSRVVAVSGGTYGFSAPGVAAALYSRNYAKKFTDMVVEVSVEVLTVADGGASVNGCLMGLRNYDAAGVALGNSFFTFVAPAVGARAIITQRFGSPAPAGGSVYNPAAALFRAQAITNRNAGGSAVAGADVQILSLTLRDVTSEVSSAGQAAAAATSASSAATSATAAGTSATAASGSATTATTQAGNASTFAGQSSSSATAAAGSATAANTSAVTASSAATTAGTAAGTATTQASSATASAAAAALSMSIAAAVGTGGGIVKDPTFQSWPAGDPLPANVGSVTGLTISRQGAGAQYGDHALRVADTTTSTGFFQMLTTGHSVPSDGLKWVAEWEIDINSGDLAAVGLQVRSNRASSYYSAFIDIGDEHPGAVAGRVYRGSKLFTLTAVGSPTGSPTTWQTYVYSNLATFGTMAPKNFSLFRLNVRPARAEEIAANEVIPALEAQAAIMAGAVADLEDQVGSAFIDLIAAAGGNPARILLKSSPTGSMVALAANAIVLQSTIGGSVIDAMKIVAGKARFGVDVEIDGDLVLSGTVTGPKIAANAASQTATHDAGGGSLNQAVKKTTASRGLTGVLAGSAIAVFWSCNVRVRGGGLTKVSFELMRADSSTIPAGPEVLIKSGEINIGSIGVDFYAGPAILRAIDVPGAGQWTYWVRMWSDVNSSPVVEIYTNSFLEIEERRK